MEWNRGIVHGMSLVRVCVGRKPTLIVEFEPAAEITGDGREQVCWEALLENWLSKQFLQSFSPMSFSTVPAMGTFVRD